MGQAEELVKSVPLKQLMGSIIFKTGGSKRWFPRVPMHWIRGHVTGWLTRSGISLSATLAKWSTIDVFFHALKRKLKTFWAFCHWQLCWYFRWNIDSPSLFGDTGTMQSLPTNSLEWSGYTGADLADTARRITLRLWSLNLLLVCLTNQSIAVVLHRSTRAVVFVETRPWLFV